MGDSWITFPGKVPESLSGLSGEGSDPSGKCLVTGELRLGAQPCPCLLTAYPGVVDLAEEEGAGPRALGSLNAA